MSLLRKHSVALFFACILAAQAVVVSFEIPNPNEFILRVRMAIPPTIALLLTLLYDGRPGILKTLKSFTKVKLHPVWYLFVLLYPPLTSAAPLYLFQLLGLREQVELNFNIIRNFDPWFFKFLFTLALCEELSWVGFGVVRLQPKFTTLTAGLMVGLVWGIWYLPLNMARIQVGAQFPNLGMIIHMMAMAAICAWVYHHTRSTILVMLMQVSQTCAPLIFPYWPRPGEEATYYAYLCIKTAAVFLLFWKFGPHPLLRAATSDALPDSDLGLERS